MSFKSIKLAMQMCPEFLLYFRRPGILVLINDVDWELRY